MRAITPALRLEIPLISLLGTHHVIMFMQRSAWRRLRRLKTRDLKTVSGYGWTSGRLPPTECDRSHHRPAVLCCYYRTTVTWHPPCVTLRHVQLSFTLNILALSTGCHRKCYPILFPWHPHDIFFFDNTQQAMKIEICYHFHYWSMF